MFSNCPNCTRDCLEFAEERVFSCPDCDFLYFHNVAASAAGFLICGDELLLTLRAKEPAAGLYDLPGGFVDPDETIECALTRELHEELGINHSDWTYLCSSPNTYNYNNLKTKTADAFFFAFINEKPILILEETEILSASWMKIADLEDEKFAFSSTQVAFKKLRKMLNL